MATAANPLVFTFDIDLSLVPAGQDHEHVPDLPEQRAGAQLPRRHRRIPAANLDPCVSERSNGTKIRLKVLTTHASHWNMGAESASLGGELAAQADGPYHTQLPNTVHAPGARRAVERLRRHEHHGGPARYEKTAP